MSLPSDTDVTFKTPLVKASPVAAAVAVALAAAVLVVVLVAAGGCALARTEPHRLIPTEPPKDTPIEGYRVEGDTSIIEAKFMKLTLRIVTEEDRSLPPVFQNMLKKHYTFFHLTIENRSTKKLRFNPLFAFLSGNNAFHSGTVGFAEIYELVAGIGADTSKSLEGERALRELKGTYFDSAEVVRPGKSTSRFLIFRPLSNDTTLAEMVIEDLTIGTALVSVRFPLSTELGEKRKVEIEKSFEELNAYDR